MTDQNDHDLLVRLDAKVEMLIHSQEAFIQASAATTKEFNERIARLEVKDSRDSEKVQAITADVQRSFSNSNRIDTLEAEVKTMGENIKDLKSKSNLFDIANAVAVGIAAAIGWFHR